MGACPSTVIFAHLSVSTVLSGDRNNACRLGTARATSCSTWIDPHSIWRLRRNRWHQSCHGSTTVGLGWGYEHLGHCDNLLSTMRNTSLIIWFIFFLSFSTTSSLPTEAALIRETWLLASTKVNEAEQFPLATLATYRIDFVFEFAIDRVFHWLVYLVLTLSTITFDMLHMAYCFRLIFNRFFEIGPPCLRTVR